MAKDEHKNDASNQLNLTVVALVALVAIVGLVALVMNAASVKTQIATGSQLASADDDILSIPVTNVAGQASYDCAVLRYISTKSGGAGDGARVWAKQQLDSQTKSGTC